MLYWIEFKMTYLTFQRDLDAKNNNVTKQKK